MLRYRSLFLAMVLGIVLPANAVQAQRFSGQPIYVQNNTDVTIWVAASYIPPGSSSYVNDGYWQVDPGQRVLIVNNNGVWIYLHAHTADGREYTGPGSPIRRTIRSKTVNLFPVDTGTDYDPRVWTVYFSNINP